MARREPPYDFVPLPSSKVSFPYPEILGHDSWKAEIRVLTGTMSLSAVVRTPVHVGSGLYELSEEVGLRPGSVVRGIVRMRDKPIIPGSSLKGAVRAVYEACTKSCLRLVGRSQREDYSTVWRKSKLPKSIVDEIVEITGQDKGKIQVSLAEDALGDFKQCPEVKRPEDLKNLCPACALFGGMGYRGRVRFSDARVVRVVPKEEAKEVGSPYSPHLHRAGEKLKVVRGDDSPYVEVSKLRGRKFYRYGGWRGRGGEPIDYLPEGTMLKFRLDFEKLLPAEVGGLLLCMGMGSGPRLRIGGGKPFGLGEVEIDLESVELLSEDGTKRAEVKDLERWKREVMEEFPKVSFFYKEGFDTLVALWNKRRS
ncbi:MAG: hypothetical protein DRP95_01705 [Candidatus Latescibacterota bacterium]|nr:MAG: hypothetical protein DRP95_01705 [Candidatus Latescibacterota bacterium]